MTNDSKYDILPRSVGDTDSDDFTDSDELLDSDDVKTYELVDKPAIVQQAKRKHKNGKINAAVVNSDPKIRERERKSKYSGVNLNRANQDTSKYNNLLDTTDNEDTDTEDDTTNETKPKKVKRITSSSASERKTNSGIPYNYYTFNNEPTNLPNLPNSANGYNPSLVQSNSPMKRKKWYERSYVIYAFVAVVLMIAIGVGLFIYFRKRRDMNMLSHYQLEIN